MTISRLVESNSQPRIDAVRMCRVSKCLPKLEAEHIHGFTFNATFDSQENRWKADSPFYEAAFNARLASKLIESGYPIRRTDRDFELASVSRELIKVSDVEIVRLVFKFCGFVRLWAKKLQVLNGQSGYRRNSFMEVLNAFASVSH